MNSLWDDVTREVAAGHRFAGLMATQRPDGVLLSVHLAGPADIVDPGGAAAARSRSYPALTPRLGAAFWYERLIHDLFGIVPEGHPRLVPLVLPQRNGTPPAPARRARRPGGHRAGRAVAAPACVGPGLFTIPHGPVRSGVMESIEYLVETPGEDIPHLNMRVFYKHRGIEKRFEGMTPADGRAARGADRGGRVGGPRAGLLPCDRADGEREVPGPPRWSGCCTPSWNGSPVISTSP